MASNKIHPATQEDEDKHSADEPQEPTEHPKDSSSIPPPSDPPDEGPADDETDPRQASKTPTPPPPENEDSEQQSDPLEVRQRTPTPLSEENQDENLNDTEIPQEPQESASPSASPQPPEQSSAPNSDQEKKPLTSKEDDVSESPASLMILPLPPIYQIPNPPTEDTILTKDKVDPVAFEKVVGINPDQDAQEGEGEDTMSAKNQIKESALRLQDATAPQTGIDHTFLRLMWILAYVGLAAVFIYQFSTLVKQYLGYPVSISIEIVSADELEFPALTVCNSNPVLKSLAGRYNKYSDLLVLDDFVMNSVFAYAEKAFDGAASGACETGYFACTTSKQCIPPQWICNKIKNCDDGSDEDSPNGEDCTDIQNEREANFTDLQGDKTCLWPYILCPDIDFCAVQCDGIVECPDGYDESTADPINCATCDEDITATTTGTDFTIDSTKYKNDMNCKYVIKTPNADKRVEITFSSLSIEGEPGDCPDYLQVFDGDRESTTAIKVDGKKKVCGNSLPAQVNYVSTGEALTIQFTTDSSLTEKGFTVAVQEVDPPSTKKRRETLENNLHTKQFNAHSASSFEKTLKMKKFREDEFREKMKKFWEDELKKNIQRRSTDSDANDDDYNYDYDYIDPYSENYEEYLENFDEASQFYSIDANDFFGLYKASKLPDYADFRLAVTFTDKFLVHNGYQKEDFIVQCTFDGKKCSSTFFKTYQDPTSGNCFSFNSIRDRNMSQPITTRRTSKTGHEYGLKLTLFLNTEEYIGLFAPNAGAKGAIHDPQVAAQINQQSSAIPVGQTTFVSIRVENVERRGGKYGNCSSDWPEFLKLSDGEKKKWPKYDRATCFSFCLQNAMALKCGCSDGFEFDYTTDAKINEGTEYYCSMTDKTQSTCRQQIYKDYEDSKLDCSACTQGCSTTTYAVTASQSPWPSESYAPYLSEKLVKSNSRKVIAYMQKILTETDVTEESIRENLRKDFARLEIYFEEMNFQKMSESPSYTLTQLITDFGGNIGLWLGWSVLCLFELFQFFYEIAVIGYNKCQ